uniref:PUM-HD domain-containing protein n=1 Tax=Zooxanthella nutricula TaxID=1333877 RepID=A0A7S2L5G2_9DINO
MTTSLVVKNTFICAIGGEDPSPLSCRMRKAWTETTASRCANDEVVAPSAWTEGCGVSAAPVAPVCERVCLEDGAQDLRRAIAAGGRAVALNVLEELAGHICQVAMSLHGGPVLEDIVGLVAAGEAAPITRELLSQADRIGTNAHSAAVLCRLLEHASNEVQVEVLFDAMLASDVAVLCCHKFGYEVAVSIMSNGAARHQRAVAVAMFADEQRFARHRFASAVMVHALLFHPVAECDELASRFLLGNPSLAALACHKFGRAVVRSLLDDARFKPQAVGLLVAAGKKVAKDKFGRVLLEEAGLAPEGGVSAAASLVIAGA